jgi:hypothetical protein
VKTFLRYSISNTGMNNHSKIYLTRKGSMYSCHPSYKKMKNLTRRVHKTPTSTYKTHPKFQAQTM